MKAMTQFNYWKEWKKYLQYYRLERVNSDEKIEPATIGEEVAKEIEAMMRDEKLAGKITVTITIGDES